MQQYPSQLHQHGRTIAMACLLLLVGMSFPATAQRPPEQSGKFVFDVLFVNRGPDKDHISAFKDSNYRNEVKVHEHYVAQNTIQWALNNARITVVTDGNYKINHPITIRKSDSRLVIGPKANIQTSDSFPRYGNVIDVNRADHVQVFNLGTLNGKAGAGVQFNGQTGGGSGINGGLIFGSGNVKNNRAGYWLVDTKNVEMPLALSRNPLYAVTGMEGALSTKIGTVGLLANKVNDNGSTVDITMNNKDVSIERAIGPSPDPNTEIVHLNNSQNATINQVTAMVGKDGSDHSLTLVDRYDVPGLMYQLERNRPLFGSRTERPIITENKGLELKNVNRVRNNVKKISKEVSYSGFPKSIPELNVEVTLNAEFEDGSTTELLSESYSFNLKK